MESVAGTWTCALGDSLNDEDLKRGFGSEAAQISLSLIIIDLS